MTMVCDQLREIGDELRVAFDAKRRVMSFAEYLELAEQTPHQQLRSSAQLVKDCFDYWGTEDVRYAWGSVRRFKLFNCPWSGNRDQLLGQEEVQNRVYRALRNFVNEGAANKLILLHGPNGSAKSTFVKCIGRALQAYSQLDQGAVYRFNWIFPKEKLSRSGIGFSRPSRGDSDVTSSFAHLADDQIDAKIADEMYDHPLLLLPISRRRSVMEGWLQRDPGNKNFVLSDYLHYGQLSHRNRNIFEALLTNYQGNFLDVLRHIQVERFFISHRYRVGYVTVEPQLSVDASEQQITQDSSISALPAALRSLTLFRYSGHLVTGNRGLIEYSDLLKRPLEAFKYLLTTVEHASVSLHNANLYLDLCFIGTSNEIHLSAFKEVAEFQSFKGRLELVRVPYLLDLDREEQIYAAKLGEAARSKHVAPHCAYVAALWAVMTRMQMPAAARYGPAVEKIVASMGPAEKAELYGEGKVPDGVASSVGKDLLAVVGEMRNDGQANPEFEGLTGASPRALQSAIFNAANNPVAGYVSAFGVLDEIEELCQHISVYGFLRQQPAESGFQDHVGMVTTVRGRLLNRIARDFRNAMGLVDDLEYMRVFERYILHVTHFCRGEKLRNSSTGAMELADEALMAEMEETIEFVGKNAEERSEFRSSLLARIGAWSLEHPDTKPVYEEIFDDYFKMLSDSYFREHEKEVSKAIEHFLMYVSDSKSALSEEHRKQAERIRENLISKLQYTENSARDYMRMLVSSRYS